MSDTLTTERVKKLLEAAVAAERERCAKIVEAFDAPADYLRAHYAAAIRSGQPIEGGKK